MKGKRGQFYIIAAVIIVSVVIGFASMKNYAKTSEDTKIYDLGDELGVETGYAYDFGVYKKQDTDSLIEDWTGKYHDYAKNQEAVEDWIFVYGNKENMNAITFTSVSSGTIDLTLGDEKVSMEMKKDIKGKQEGMKVSGNKIDVNFKNSTYSFELKQGQNFYFIIKSKGYIATN